MTVVQNVGYGLEVTGVPESEIRTRVVAALSLVQLDGLKDRQRPVVSQSLVSQFASAAPLLLGGRTRP